MRDGPSDHCTAPKTAWATQVASTAPTSRRAAAASRPRSLPKTITPHMAARRTAASTVNTGATLRASSACATAKAGSASAGAARRGSEPPARATPKAQQATAASRTAASAYRATSIAQP